MKANQPKLSEILKTDNIYILFGGPSLKGFDLSALDNKATLACNKCAEVYSASCVISIDPTYINTRREFLRDYKGRVAIAYRATANNSNKKPNQEIIDKINPDYLYWLDKKHPDKMSNNEEIIYGSNTGHAAINFSVLQGFKTIHALGLDMGRRSHWHGGYSNSGIPEMSHWAEMIDGCKDWLEEKGVRLVNYNKDSNVRAYEFGELREIENDI